HGDAVVESDLPLIARIPEDPAVDEADLAGTPIAEIPDKSPARVAVRDLAARLVEICARRRG
ncbi:MAG TPA: carbon monoxide dehydrogenase maturation protein, partial [Methanoculleus sp.]|nr:carbon monoxide dehydrogenase maturation protein [Methanoculleus sp.]